MYVIKLDWKECRIDLSNLDRQLKQIYPSYLGNQAHSHLELYFSEPLSDEQKLDIEILWECIDESHELSQSYKSAEQVELEKLAKKQSAKTKLLALGLDEEELKALLNY